MAQRTVDPKAIKSLTEWVAQWHKKATNLGFDPETREPTIYDTTKARAKVSSIPWKREADTLTILAQPSRFTPKAVASASSRYGKLREQRDQHIRVAEEQLRAAESTLLDAWRSYNAASPAVRGPLRRDILAAEVAVRDIEKSMADKGRITVKLAEGTGVYVPSMSVKRRGFAIEETV